MKKLIKNDIVINEKIIESRRCDLCKFNIHQSSNAKNLRSKDNYKMKNEKI